MNIKILLTLSILILSHKVDAQEVLNNYKYIVVSKKFDFLKSEDQYQLNSLTKFLFKKEGFYALFDNEIKPDAFANDQCKGLNVKVKNNSGMFRTKLIVELINCKNEIVFTSKEGMSKQKEYKKAYQEALRDAFTSLTALSYKYSPTVNPVILQKKVLVEEDKRKVKVVNSSVEKKELVKEVVVDKEEVAVVEDVVPVKTETVVKEVPFEVVEKVAPVKEEIIVAKQKINNVEHDITSPNLLYAQANETGYQLVDSTPKVVYILLKSSKEEVYFLKNKIGIVFKEDKKWFVEYYQGKTKVKDELHIKF